MDSFHFLLEGQVFALLNFVVLHVHVSSLLFYKVWSFLVVLDHFESRVCFFPVSKRKLSQSLVEVAHYAQLIYSVIFYLLELLLQTLLVLYDHPTHLACFVDEITVLQLSY